MNRVHCPEPAVVGEWLELPTTDARRLHLDSCPRCRALVSAYEEFLDVAPRPSDLTVDETALARLSTFAAALASSHAEAAPSGSRDRVVRGAAPRRRGRGRWLGIALTAAAATAFALLRTPQESELTTGVVRGSQRVDLPTIEVENGSGLRIDWSPREDADHYQLRILSSDLEELTRIDVTSGPPARIEPDRLRSIGAGHPVLLLQVIALRGGDEIDRSPAVVLPSR